MKLIMTNYNHQVRKKWGDIKYLAQYSTPSKGTINESYCSEDSGLGRNF